MINIIEIDGDKYKCILKDKNNNYISKIKWYCLKYHQYKNFFYIRSNDDKFNLINNDGEFLSDVWFDCVTVYGDAPIRIELNNKYNYIDDRKKPISNIWFDMTAHFKDGFANVILNDKHNIINQDGKLIYNIWYDWISPYSIKSIYRTVYLKDKGMNFIKYNNQLLSDIWVYGYSLVSEDNAWARDNLFPRKVYVDKQNSFYLNYFGDLIYHNELNCDEDIYCVQNHYNK